MHKCCPRFYKMLNSLPIFSTRVAAYKSSNLASHKYSEALGARRAACSAPFGHGLQSLAASNGLSNHLYLSRPCRWWDSSPGQLGHTSCHSSAFGKKTGIPPPSH